MSILQYTKPEQQFGNHFIVEYMGCDSEQISWLHSVQESFLTAAEKSNATILNDQFHQFQPYGVSGVILIAESHFTIHTWPENNYAAVDIFTCGEQMKPEVAAHSLKEAFKAKDMKIYVMERGIV